MGLPGIEADVVESDDNAGNITQEYLDWIGDGHDLIVPVQGFPYTMRRAVVTPPSPLPGNTDFRNLANNDPNDPGQGLQSEPPPMARVTPVEDLNELDLSTGRPQRAVRGLYKGILDPMDHPSAVIIDVGPAAVIRDFFRATPAMFVTVDPSGTGAETQVYAWQRVGGNGLWRDHLGNYWCTVEARACWYVDFAYAYLLFTDEGGTYEVFGTCTLMDAINGQVDMGEESLGNVTLAPPDDIADSLPSEMVSFSFPDYRTATTRDVIWTFRAEDTSDGSPAAVNFAWYPVTAGYANNFHVPYIGAGSNAIIPAMMIPLPSITDASFNS